jgi:hypothetical protein
MQLGFSYADFQFHADGGVYNQQSRPTSGAVRLYTEYSGQFLTAAKLKRYRPTRRLNHNLTCNL